MSYVLAFAGFALLIILHELGHFAAAKAVGMRVERFALFFPPLLWKVRRGETEYGIGAIPLGGYVRITGMNPNEELAPEVAPRAYYNQPVWKRVVVIAAGPLTNVLVAFLILWGLYVFQGSLQITPKVASVDVVSPAAGVLRPGDEILAVDGRRGDTQAFSDAIAAHHCAGGLKVDGCNAATRAHIELRRGGVVRHVVLTPAYDATYGRSRLGFAFGSKAVHAGVVSAVGSSAKAMWRVTKATGTALAKLVYDKKARDQVSGVVGSYEVTRETIKTFGVVDALNIIAIISLSLAIVNLFPFLPLDGGHIFWALAEKLRGRPIAFSVMERASIVGFMLVILLFAVGLSNDIGRLRGAGFGVQ